MDGSTFRKARGAFFTPPEISRYIAEWAIRSPQDQVLEPSCGEAGFLVAAGRRLRELGAARLLPGGQLRGVEIHRDSADAALAALAGEGLDAAVEVADFFDVAPVAAYDAVVGNPPYVRYQRHVGQARLKGLEAALAQGVRLNGLASSWAAFVVHACAFLKPGGRLGLVLPAELLTVNYAAEVRRFLLKRFGRIRLVLFETLVFPGVLEEVVLLLAEGREGAGCFETCQSRDLTTLRRVEAAPWMEHRAQGGEKWTPALLGASLSALYRHVSSGDGFAPLKHWGGTSPGSVTGNNAFFALSRPAAKLRGLGESELLRISPPGSRHLRDLAFTQDAWDALMAKGAHGLLFRPSGRLSEAGRLHVEAGERSGVARAYKCSVRSPWWRVPLVTIPDLFLTYMDHKRPRLIANEARVHILNSLYGVSLKRGRKRLGRELLPLACLNSITLLGAEMVGRTYGGGLLKLEPREADLMPMPSEALLHDAGEELRSLRPRLSAALLQGNVAGAVELADHVILTKHLGLSGADLAALRRGRDIMLQRRMARAKGAHAGI